MQFLTNDTPTQLLLQESRVHSLLEFGDNEFFLGSDASPIIEYTDKVVYLEDENIAVMKLGEELKIVNIQNESLAPVIKKSEY